MTRLLPIALALLTTSTTSLADGPIGFGGLKLGMTKAQVEALPDSEPVRVALPMTPVQHKKTAPVANVDIFDAQLVTPLDSSPIKATLTFKEGRLTNISAELSNSSNVLERLSKQISDKYGQGDIEDNRKEKQCTYGNGATFKIKSGSVHTIWTSSPIEGGSAVTALRHLHIEQCPAELGTGALPSIQIRTMSITLTDPLKANKNKNLF